MLDKIWESPIARILMPLRRSMEVSLFLLLMFIGAIGFLVVHLNPQPPPVAPLFFIGLLLLLAGTALLLFLATEGRAVTISAAHEADGPALLLQASALLRRAGFAISAESETALTARRGSDISLGTHLLSLVWVFWVEPEWRDLPIELSITVKTAERGALLAVRGRYRSLVPVGRSGERLKALLAKTAAAVAALDPAALAVADGSVVIVDDLGLRFGGLAMKVWAALLATSVLSMGVIIWHGHAWMWTKAAMVDADELKERAQDMRYGLTGRVSAALIAEVVAIQMMKEVSGLSEIMRALPPTVESFPLFVGTVGERGIVQFIPRTGVVARPPAGIHVSSGASGTMFQGLPGGLFYGYSVILSEPAARSLGMKSVVLGTVLTFSDIERLAPIIRPTPTAANAPIRTWWLPWEIAARLGAPGLTGSEERQWLPAELVVWRDGRSVVRLNWYFDRVRCKLHVSRGEDSIPDSVAAEALAARARQASPSTVGFSGKLAGIFTPEADASSGIVREEIRGGKARLAVYFLGGGEDSAKFSGYSFAAANSPHRLQWALFAYEVTCLIVPALFVLVVMIAGLVLSARITGPVFEIKDALKSIVDGNFSVRLKTKRKDELGRLAAVVNKAAEGLEMREAIIALLGKYMTRQAAEGVLRKDAASAPAGDHREVSVLFADLRGFAGLSERRPVGAVVESLEEYFAVMALVIASNGGVLDKCGGDGLMAIFNAPLDQPDHARRAILTALEMQEAFQSLNLKRVRRGEEPIAIGIGVDTGMALLGMTGSVQRMEIPAIGDAANLASRLVRYPLRGQVIIGPGAFEKVKGSIEYEALGKVAVEGKADPVEAWLVMDFKPR